MPPGDVRVAVATRADGARAPGSASARPVSTARLRAAERASAADLVQRLATVPPALAQLLASIAASDATHVTVLAETGAGHRTGR